MDFIDEIKHFSKKIDALSQHIKTEEATKHSLIMPFIQLLGYDVFDPSEVVPEYTADIGTKKGEKVDYAIMVNGKPAILLEAKCIGDLLTTHDTQLFRYFSATEARFAILTNGIVYKFYSDLQQPNKLDDSPFLEFNLLDIKEALVPELKKFQKENFDSEALFSTAANLKYVGQIKTIMDAELKDPSVEFCRYLLKQILPAKPITQNVMDKFRPLIKKALSLFVTDLINEKLKSALSSTDSDDAIGDGDTFQDVDYEEDAGNSIVTTDEELEGFFLIKSLLRQVVPPQRIFFKDNKSYSVVLIDNNVMGLSVIF